MRNEVIRFAALAIALWSAGDGRAQDEPLSVIDWVQRSPDARPEAPPAAEPAAALPPDVRVDPLDGQPTELVGLVPARVTGLPETLWQNSLSPHVEARLAALPHLRVPAGQALLYALLLTEAYPPRERGPADDLFTVARIRTLLRLGALDPAAALAEQAGVDRDPAHFAVYMDVALLSGSEDEACAVLSARPYLAPDLATRIFCAIRAGDWALAALLFDTGRALDAFSPNLAAALERFIDPEFADGADALPAPLPEEISPLLFRLYETIGEPLPTRGLQPAYAHADLRDIAGWKAQLEAAERLARAGAVPANQLLGLYTARAPAASGGIWDRVAAVQRFDTALGTGSPDAVAKTLPDAWDAMRDADLGAPFATLFSAPLANIPLGGFAALVKQDMALITSGGRTPAPTEAIIARAARHPLGSAITAGLRGTAARADLVTLARDDRSGEALLAALRLLEAGAAGDPSALASGLSSLQAMGQGATAQRAAAEILVLELFP
jgi:hypothetical protein